MKPEKRLPIEEKRMYDLKQASVYMGIPVKSIREMITDGEIIFIKRESKTRDRRLYYIDKQDMDKWIESHKQQRRIL